MAFQATKSTETYDSLKNSGNSAPANNKQIQDADGLNDLDNIDNSSKVVAAPELYGAKVKQNDLILFTTQLSVMLDSGVVLSDALDAIAKQAEYGAFKMIIMNVAERVKSGDDFSKALADYPKVFNTMFVSMVKASEVSGRMAEMLTVLSGYLNFESETRKQIKGALTYPFIMALMAVAATGTLMFFVLPRFMGIYESRGAALPKLTQILVNFSKMLGNFNIMTIILTVLILISMALYYWAGTLSGRRVIDFIKIRTPVLGTMFVDTVVTRSMRIMATMINTGVNLLESIEVMQGSCQNYYFQKLWEGVDEKIRAGYQLSESILISPGSELIAPGIIQMLRAGEKSGKLGEVCDKISVFYEKARRLDKKRHGIIRAFNDYNHGFDYWYNRYSVAAAGFQNIPGYRSVVKANQE